MEILSASLSVLSFLICLFLLFKKRKIDTNESTALSNEKYDDICHKSKQIIQLIISNNTSEVKECLVFGCGQFLLSKNFGSSDGIEIKPSSNMVSYLLLLLDSAINPFKTKLIRISSKNTEQLKEIIEVVSTESNGNMCAIPIVTEYYYKQNQPNKFVNDIDYEIIIDVNTFLKMNVFPNTSFTITFFVSDKVHISRILRQNLSKVKNNFNNLIKK